MQEASIPFLKYHNMGHADNSIADACRAFSETQQAPLIIADIGGGDGEFLSGLLSAVMPEEKFRIQVVDIIPEADVAYDITTELPAHLENAFDVVCSIDALEHIKHPFRAAANMVKMLRPNGLLAARTVFSWRFHPVPNDYFRYSDEGLRLLFTEMNGVKELYCAYDLKMRRDDIQGGYFGDTDIPPLDQFGGFRENWYVFFIGLKKQMGANI